MKAEAFAEVGDVMSAWVAWRETDMKEGGRYTERVREAEWRRRWKMHRKSESGGEGGDQGEMR